MEFVEDGAGENKVMNIEERLNKIEYHQRLLLEMMEKNKYPFYELIIQKGLSEQEVTQLYRECLTLEKMFEEQREMGFVLHTDLIAHFLDVLPTVLTPKETVESLYKQLLFKPLMEHFMQALEKMEKES